MTSAEIYPERLQQSLGFDSKVLDSIKQFSVCMVDFQSMCIIYSELPSQLEIFYHIDPVTVENFIEIAPTIFHPFDSSVVSLDLFCYSIALL
jgi:hypothetical protein